MKKGVFSLLILFLSSASLIFADSWLVKFSIKDDNSNEYILRDQQMQVFCDSSFQAKNKAITALGFNSSGIKILKDKKKLRFILEESYFLSDREGAIFSSPSSKMNDWIVVYFVLNLETYDIEEGWGRIQVRANSGYSAYNRAKSELGYNSSGTRNMGGAKVKLLPRAIFIE